MSYRGKHRKMSAATRHIARVAIAQCESSGNWNTNTGNGYYGGLQFSQSTWRAYGGTGSAHNASREQQIAVAERVLQGQGINAWPNCGKKGGSASPAKAKSTAPKATKKVTPKKSTAPVTKQQAPAPARVAAVTNVANSNPAGDYTVVAGDTLSKIASKFNVQGGFQKLQQLNKEYVPNADFIVVGQKLATK
ncbi:transglycosylase family protein [Amycolatopsis regifaucium]|uniref:Transglycosylase n=1 Tax=Amycolatopsis regifaucium TaxID=546365 RepID=A0ABX3DT69_9PSEU|nr:transglycosylase family protein [Amycolatopsis regifaucium]OKA08080.1 transglycosylase [Amycolatopsis regifaucium]